MMSGSFYWSDERLGDVVSICRQQGSWAFRFLMGYRASLIFGNPDDSLRPTWDQLLNECPNWPGFRPERSSQTLAATLDNANKCH